MNRLRLFAVILSVMSILLIAGCSANWQEFTADDGSFSVEFPGKPSKDTDFQNTGNGVTVTSAYYSYTPLYGIKGVKYNAGYADYNHPNMEDMEWDNEKAKQGAKSGIRSKGGKVLNERDVDVSGYEGWEFIVSVKNSSDTLRMVRVDNRLYLLEIVHPKGKDYTEEMDRFFDSFNIIGGEYEDDEEGDY